MELRIAGRHYAQIDTCHGAFQQDNAVQHACLPQHFGANDALYLWIRSTDVDVMRGLWQIRHGTSRIIFGYTGTAQEVADRKLTHMAMPSTTFGGSSSAVQLH